MINWPRKALHCTVSSVYQTHFALFFLIWMSIATPAMALEQPSGEVILTVSGNIAITNSEASAVFDLTMLEGLPQTRFSTSTIWTEGLHEFTGVSLRALMDVIGAKGKILEASAINDYSVEIPMGDAVENGAMVAYLMDEQPMSVREKGPLWVVYPYDQNADFQTETIYSRSIWQLMKIAVTD